VEDCKLPSDTGNLTQEQCHDRWCSWYPNSEGPWCQRPLHARHTPFSAMPVLTPSTDCGWAGMDTQQCVDRGCQWKPADPGAPWCTYVGPNQQTLEDTMAEEAF
jgi:hypothetical protein